MSHILLLCGGPSNEREVSLDSGRAIYDALITLGHRVTLADPDHHLTLSLYDKPEDIDTCDLIATQAITADLTDKYDIAFIALHGSFGEDGYIQAYLDTIGIPYTGSSMSASSLCFDKEFTHKLLANQNITQPQTLIFRDSDARDDMREETHSTIGFPCFVKPARSGSSVGVSRVENADALDAALTEAFAHDTKILVQKFIPGAEFSCAVMDAGDGEITTFPVIEIAPAEAAFFTYDEKYSATDGATETCPAQISDTLSDHIRSSAHTIHTQLSCSGLSRSDFIYDKDDDTLYFLEINTLPGMTKTSLCPQEAQAAGYSFTDLVDIILRSATTPR